MSVRTRAAFSDHLLAAYLPVWELDQLEQDYLSARRAFSVRNDPGRLDRDAFLVGWVAALKRHHYRGWKDGVAP